MQINAALVAELAVLTEALDDADTDIVETLLHLVAGAHAAVPSYLGLTVTVTGSDPPITITSLEDTTEVGDIRTSLRFDAPDAGHDGPMPRVSLVLYAGNRGAFVDLAADLSWLTGRKLTGVILDAQLTIPAEPDPAAQLRAASLVNQALGVLIGRGHTPGQAQLALDARAADAGTDRSGAATLILATVPVLDGDPDS
ncbi:MAG: hypothetical protein M3Y89_07810 [Actinomycetota bacterium]|nr:hypothetical protein [Actinomycetota bacterium]